MRTHIYNNLPEQYTTMIKILENQIPLPAVEETMDALRRDDQATGLKKEIGDEATGSALFSRGRYRGHGGHRGRARGRYRGRGNYGGNKGGDSNDDKEYTCTHCKLKNHTTENCGILKRLNSKEETLCYHCGKRGHIRPECRTPTRLRSPKQGQQTKQQGLKVRYEGIPHRGDCISGRAQDRSRRPRSLLTTKQSHSLRSHIVSRSISDVGGGLGSIAQYVQR